MPNVHNELLRMEHLDTLRSERRLKCDGNKKKLTPELDFVPNVMAVYDRNLPVLAGCESWFGRLEPRAGRSPRSGGERTRCRWRKWHTIFESWCRADEVDPTWPKSTLTSTPIKWRWQKAMYWGKPCGIRVPWAAAAGDLKFSPNRREVVFPARWRPQKWFDRPKKEEMLAL